MQRRMLAVGDPPARGGSILPYSAPFTNKMMGRQVAIIGGRVYCDACGSIGLIAKSGGPRRMGYITEVALEGDLCVCRCPQPQPLVSTLSGASTFDDTDYGAGAAIPLWRAGADDHLVASKVVDEQVEHPPEAKMREDICPNMTNKAFAQLMIELRDEAIRIIDLRLQELERWDQIAKGRILAWFGDPGFGLRTAHLTDLRAYLKDGMHAAQRVLRGLEASNFVRWSSTALEHVGCINPTPTLAGVAAQVCGPDVKTRTIVIGLQFCRLQRTTRIFGTNEFGDGDSQLQTLIHEVTHFEDVFNSTDDWYQMRKARRTLVETRRLDIARVNADNIVGYILGAEE